MIDQDDDWYKSPIVSFLVTLFLTMLLSKILGDPWDENHLLKLVIGAALITLLEGLWNREN